MDLGGWPRSLGLRKYEAAFRDNDRDEAVLPSLTHETLKELWVTVVGHLLKLRDAILALRSAGLHRKYIRDGSVFSSRNLPWRESDVKLYNWQLSPNCRRVRMFILEKGMDMPEIEEVGATAEQLVPGGQFSLSDNYIKVWPHALVPMLETDGLRIGEAMAICRFLEDEHPGPNLMGRGGREKACIEMWERRAYDEGFVGATEAFRNAHPVFIDHGLPGSSEPVPQIPALVERGTGRVTRFYRKFDEQLKENRFVAGDRFTVADITALCAVDFGKIVGIPVPQDCRSLARWYDEVSARPAAKASV